MNQKKSIKILEALAQDTRMNIYKLLIQENKDGLSAGTIAEILEIPPATLSFHLTHMENADLLKSHRKGRSIMYSAKQKAIKNLIEFLTENSFKEREEERA